MSSSVKFLGAAQNVTGSCYLLEIDNKRILIDCGLYQERDFKKRNWEPFPVPPDTIDCVLLTHAHLDHCGLLPKLVREGFTGKIYCNHAASEIAQIVILDSARIQEDDAAYKNKRHQREGRKNLKPVVPLYTVEDAEAVIPLFSPVDYESRLQPSEGIEVSFHDAGHILGASMIRITFSVNHEKRTIIFSGDVGRNDKPIIEDPTTFESADYVVIESTYGDRTHDETEDIPEKLATVINNACNDGGNIIVPSFAIERCQELLYYLNELLMENRIPQIKVFLDSPMAIRVTEVFKRHPELFDTEMKTFMKQGRSPFDFPGLTMTTTSDESKAINHAAGSSMIIAGSGMITGGRIKHHLVTNISRRESTILFVGYQAAGTLGREILNGLKQVRILGQKHKVKARIARIGGFSAHADKNELLEWLSSLKKAPRGIFITHGEAEAALSFADFLKTNGYSNVAVPEYQDEIALN